MKKGLLFVVVIIPLLIFVGLRRNSAPFFSVKEHQCVMAEFLSEDYCSSISSSLVELLNQKYAAPELIARLKKQFSVLDKIVVSYRPSAVHVTMSAHEPICCINDNIILTSHNELVPKNFFSVNFVEAIPTIAVLQDDMTNIPFFVAALLHDLPAEFNQQYNLEFMNEHCVRLIDKQQSNFTIALTVAQKKSSMLFAQCESVKKSINARADFDKGVKWIADIRFAGYIVAYKT